jgi:hypothetical protein
MVEERAIYLVNVDFSSLSLTWKKVFTDIDASLSSPSLYNVRGRLISSDLFLVGSNGFYFLNDYFLGTPKQSYQY